MELWELFNNPDVGSCPLDPTYPASKRQTVQFLRALHESIRSCEPLVIGDRLPHLSNLVLDTNRVLSGLSMYSDFKSKYLTKNDRRTGEKGFWEAFGACIAAIDRDKNYTSQVFTPTSAIYRPDKTNQLRQINPAWLDDQNKS